MAQATDLQSTTAGTIEQRRDELVARIPALDPTKAYVAAGLEIGLSQVILALPRYADDLQREQGDEIYDRMMKDPAIFTAVQTLIEIVLMNPARVEPAISDETEPDYELAVEISDFVEYNLTHLQRPLTQVLSEMMNAFVYGSAIAEKVYSMRITREYGMRLFLEGIKPLARKNYSFVIDDWGNVVGFMARRPGQSHPPTTADPSLIVERDKFAVLAFGVVGSDPRGRSQIRAAYNAWWFKLQVYPRFLKYLQQFSTPSIIGFTPGNGEDFVELKDSNGAPVLDSSGRPMRITKPQAMLNALVQFQAGSAIAMEGGCQVEIVESKGNGEAFRDAIESLNRELFLAIIGNARANMEAEHGSKADSESGQDTLSRKAEWVRNHVEQMLSQDIVHQLVAINWGDDVANRLSPIVTLTAADKEDRADMMKAISSLFEAGFIDDSQIQGIDAMLNLPARDFDAWIAKRKEQQDLDRELQKAESRIANPMQGEQ